MVERTNSGDLEQYLTSLKIDPNKGFNKCNLKLPEKFVAQGNDSIVLSSGKDVIKIYQSRSGIKDCLNRYLEITNQACSLINKESLYVDIVDGRYVVKINPIEAIYNLENLGLLCAISKKITGNTLLEYGLLNSTLLSPLSRELNNRLNTTDIVISPTNIKVKGFASENPRFVITDLCADITSLSKL
jgi:hypothetical protein